MLANFYVTGPMRSGTTLLASLLNSQSNSACIEDRNPLSMRSRSFKSIEDFNSFNAYIEAQFIEIGLPAPELRLAKSAMHMLQIYCSHARELLGVDHLGFKITMMDLRQIKECTNEGSKVLLMRRTNSYELLSSWIGRVRPSLEYSFKELSRYYHDINNYCLSEDLKSSAMVIDYEMLVSNPVPTLDQISDFLGVKLVEPEVTYHSWNRLRKSEFVGNSSKFNYGSCEIDQSFLAGRLKRKYTDEQIRKHADLLDQGKLRFMQYGRNYLYRHLRRLATRIFEF